MARKRRLGANLRYLFALIARFRVTVIMAGLLFGLTPLIYFWRFPRVTGQPLAYGEALHHVYFLLYGQPSLPYINDWLLEGMNVVIPPLGIALVVDGVVRFAYLYFAKHRSDKDWIAVMSKTLKDHVVICGAGRVGYRVATELLGLGREVIVIEKREDASFVAVLRDKGVPVLIDDIKSPNALERTNIRAASSLVAATDDDLANMNVALDARRHNPGIRVVIRLFDDDLVAKVRDAFKAEAHSTSALAAPALALAALDPRILHSFRVGTHLMVVSTFNAQQGLPGISVSEIRDRFGGFTLSLRRGSGPEQLHPQGYTEILPADMLTIQLEYADYEKLRVFTGEQVPPSSVPHPAVP